MRGLEAQRGVGLKAAFVVEKEFGKGSVMLWVVGRHLQEPGIVL